MAAEALRDARRPTLQQWKTALKKVEGMWADNPDVPDIRQLRASADREEWLRFAAANLARAYGDDEPEYTLADVKVFNPHYREE